MFSALSIPNVSVVNALQNWRELLGEGAVLGADQAQRSYAENTLAAKLIIMGAVKPGRPSIVIERCWSRVNGLVFTPIA